MLWQSRTKGRKRLWTGAERQLRVRHILVRPDQEDLLKDIEAQLKGALPLTHGHCPFIAARLFRCITRC